MDPAQDQLAVNCSRADGKPSSSTVTEQPSEIEQLRNEFAEQFATLKKSYEEDRQSLEDKLQTMGKENEELKRALIRSAVVPPQEQPAPEPTEEELYAARVKSLSEKTLETMKGLY